MFNVYFILPIKVMKSNSSEFIIHQWINVDQFSLKCEMWVILWKVQEIYLQYKIKMNCISLILTNIDEKLKLVKSLNWNVHFIYQWHEIIVYWWNIGWRPVNSNRKGSIADEGLLHLGLFLTFMPFEQGGVFIVTNLLGCCFRGVIKRLLLSLGLWF